MVEYLRCLVFNPQDSAITFLGYSYQDGGAQFPAEPA